MGGPAAAVRGRRSARPLRAAAIVAACCLFGIAGAGHADTAAPAARDDLGRDVVLRAPARRIVTLAPHATELLFAVGAGDRVVAVERSSDHPPAARALPRLSAYPRPDLERIVAHSPDLVVIWGAGASRDLVPRLEALGVPTFVSEPRSLEGVASSLERLGRLAGAQDEAARQARLLRERVAALRARHAGRSAVPVFVQVWAKPLMTLSDRDMIGDALRVCAARNVFGELASAAAQVDPESVLHRAPRMIVAFEGDSGRAVWQRLGVLAPQGRIRYVEVDRVLQRPTPRLLAELERACAAIDRLRAD